MLVSHFLHFPLVGRTAAADKGCSWHRILIVDDHPLTREALSSLLGAHGFDVAGEASDGAMAVVEAARLLPDLVLLDLSMPGMDGLTALPQIRAAAPDCEVVVLTASGTEANLLAAIRGGAAGYLLKTEPPERIARFLEGRERRGGALRLDRRRLLDEVRTATSAAPACPTRSPPRSRHASSRCCFCSTTISAPTRSRTALHLRAHRSLPCEGLLRKLNVSSRRGRSSSSPSPARRRKGTHPAWGMPFPNAGSPVRTRADRQGRSSTLYRGGWRTLRQRTAPRGPFAFY